MNYIILLPNNKLKCYTLPVINKYYILKLKITFTVVSKFAGRKLRVSIKFIMHRNQNL